MIKFLAAWLRKRRIQHMIYPGGELHPDLLRLYSKKPLRKFYDDIQARRLVYVKGRWVYR